jgi:hypothetical protein
VATVSTTETRVNCQPDDRCASRRENIIRSSWRRNSRQQPVHVASWN